MSADWATCRVVRQEDAGLFFRTEDALVNAGGPTWRAQDGEPWTTRDLCELLPLAPVLDADGLPVVATVGDLTARHIGRRVRVETDRTLPHRVRLLREIATASNEAARLTLEVIDHPEWFHMAHFTLDTPCEVLP